MNNSGVTVFSSIDGSAKKEYFDSPSMDKLSQIISNLTIDTQDTAIYFTNSNAQITIRSAEYNRVYILWSIQSFVSCLLDESLLDSTERIETSDDQGGPFPINETVTKENAIKILSYFYKNGKFPKNSVWSANMKDFI